MLYNHKDKVIFICVPKTGTTAVENYILKNNDDYLRNFIVKNEKIKVNTHTSVKYLNHILGEEFNKYKILAIARNPLECIISKYFFFKKGRANEKFVLFLKKKQILNLMKVIAARFLDFNLWCLFYVFRVNTPYLLVNNNLPKNVFVIDFEQFKKQPKALFNLFPNLSFEQKDFLLLNKTKYEKTDVKLWRLTKFILYFKLRKENLFYECIKNKNLEKN